MNSKSHYDPNSNSHYDPNSKSHYEHPTIIRKATISHFNEKYDTPNFYNIQHNNNNNTHHNNTHHNNTHHNNSHHYQHASLRASKSLGSLSPSTETNMLSECDVLQIEAFFRAHKTYVYVGRCLVNLYFTKTDLINGGRSSKPRIHEWELARTGVPVIIFDKGETKARDKRQLQICLAERGSGFVLWKDIIDNLSDYSSHHPCFHTLYLSCDHRKMAGLSFDNQLAAQQFHDQIKTLTSDPLNIALTGPKKTNKKLKILKKQLSLGGTASNNNKLPKKCDISSPCLFQHVTSVDLNDYENLYSMNTLVPYHHQQQQLHTKLSPTKIITSSTSASTSISSSESNVSV